MRTIMITAPSSNTGKTTITLGIIRAIRNRGLDISAFKTGPDFIDTKYLELASGKRAGNLDIHLMGRSGIKKSLSMNNGEYGVIEGVMGYFDGIYNTYENSSFDISKELDIPAILVYRPQGEMFSVIPKIKGMVDFPGSKIKGIILNKVNKEMFLLLKEKIEEYIDIEVLGYLPKDISLEVESRYLGLMQTYENTDCEELISRTAESVEKTIDIDKILKLSKEIEVSSYKYERKRNIDVAIAYDEAFNFYYNENLNLFENICNVKYFSPIRDNMVPKSDFIYIGGGYPELYKEELSSNIEMISSIRENAMTGKPIIAEAGGFMYLVSSIEDYSMCNLFNGSATMTGRLQRFGYVNILLNKDTLLGKRESMITGNEYHRSIIDIKEEPVFDITKPMNIKKKWQCGYIYKNVLAYYQHINFLGNMEAFNYLLDNVENIRREG
ncbi:cobyrinate a,c-diamide synthase [Tissierella praeacuta]|uniref:cobyrinate a,c-diamide synthase n=1 Tax=Tissierella praeacuta TaxID=43131 RepID=UPI0028AE3CBF|nr:cobyrinate a,c-diamide synthase [Tissierella praeacuta]